MKKGIDYASSREKRNFDVAVSSLLVPGKRCAEFVIGYFMERGEYSDLSPILRQRRMGWNNRIFEIEKFQTLDTDTHQPINKVAKEMRRLGLDELAQVENIKTGDMSFTGPRPLIVSEYEAIRDELPERLGQRWESVVMTMKPGLYSSYGIYSHVREMADPNEPEIRAEMDIKDAVDASVVNDIALTHRFISAALTRRLK